MSRALRRSAFLLLLVACGSRTGLFIDDEPGALPDDGGGGGGGGEGGADGGRDRNLDANEEPLPPIDAQPPADADKTGCLDADTTLIYVITEQYELFSFFPPSGAFTKIGNINCPVVTPNSTPFSMGVDRKGVAYVVFNDGNLFRVSTATAACIGTSFTPNQQNFFSFGMGFATIQFGPAEQLFIASDGFDQQGNPTGQPSLGRIDPGTFKLTSVGPFDRSVWWAELTGTGTGQLYAFYRKDSDRTNDNAPTFIGQIDKTTAEVIAETPMPSTLHQYSGWAFAYWGGDFYIFTGASPQATNSIVTRFRPTDGTAVQVATLPTLVVGAGVSTCAPE